MPTISVIVPVYNVEPYLHRCIDSILAQTYTDFELILVDDGSPDNCGEICDEYAAKDSRIKVIHKANGGVSSARNTGLNVATGKYVTFVDSDDELLENALEVLLQGAKNYSSEILIVGGLFTSLLDSSNNKVENIGITKREYLLVQNDEFYCKYDAIWSSNNMLSSCGKLFSLCAIKSHSICFDESMVVLEDACFVLTYLLYASMVVSVPFQVYCIHDIIGRNSWLHRSKKDYSDDVLKASYLMQDFCSQYHISKNAICRQQVFSCFDVALQSLILLPTSGVMGQTKKWIKIIKFRHTSEFQKYVWALRCQRFRRTTCLLTKSILGEQLYQSIKHILIKK